jgi:hypothetical protein
MIPIYSIPIADDKKKEVVGFLWKTFEASVQARTTQVEGNYKRWLDNYASKPMQEVRTSPFLRASNFVPGLIRMHCDIMHARLYGLLLACRPFWKPTTLIPEVPHEDLAALTEFMQFISWYRVYLPQLLDDALRRVLKTGQVFMKGPWMQDTFWFPEGQDDKGNVSGKEITTETLELKSLPFEDVWMWPITANDLTEVKIKFHRIRLTEGEVKERIGDKRWDADAGALVLNGPGESPGKDAARQTRATEAGINLTKDVDRPFSVIEAHLRYDLGDGKTCKYVITFNPAQNSEKGYLRGYFSPYKRLEDCFVSINLLPREDLIYGYSFPEILEQFQEEQAQIHNGRRDASLIANVPGWKKKRDPTVPNPSSEWYPGKVFELADMDDLQPLTFGGSYNSMIDEESFLLQLAERTTGITTPMQGAGTGSLAGKRGIYANTGTLAMLAEGNRRLDIYLKRLRFPMHSIGDLIYQSYRTFNPTGAEFTSWGKTGEAIKRIWSFTEPDSMPGYFFEMAASDAGANKETDRTALLLMANTMAAYYRQVTEAASVAGQVPDGHPLRQTLLMVLDGAKDLADRLLFAFDIGDRKRLLPDMRQILGGGTQQGADQAVASGMPGTEEPLSIDRLQALRQATSAVPR